MFIGSEMASTAGRTLSAPPAALAAARGGRLTALDQMRAFVVGLVVLHHAALAYCTFGHIDRVNYTLSTAPIVDPRQWVGFDLLVRLNDSFFMPLLFLLSGVFVWDGLIRHGPAAFLGARVRRLGLPFVIAVLTIVPLAYYPSFFQAGGAVGFGRFWVNTVTTGPWPSGPPWFIGVLLVFDVAAALVFVLLSGRLRVRSATPRPIASFVLLLAGSCLLYLPLLHSVGPTRWFGIGPLAIQGSRIGLYAAYFAAGVALGRGGLPVVVRFARVVASGWAAWVLLAVLTATTFIAVGKMSAGGGPHLPASSGRTLLGMAQVIFCAAMVFALLAIFLRFGGGRSRASGSLVANSFGIYLLHYPFVTWTQYGLLAARMSAQTKCAVALTVALAASWASASLLRRLPWSDRIL